METSGKKPDEQLPIVLGIAQQHVKQHHKEDAARIQASVKLTAHSMVDMMCSLEEACGCTHVTLFVFSMAIGEVLKAMTELMMRHEAPGADEHQPKRGNPLDDSGIKWRDLN